MKYPHVCVIIPTYNEQDTIGPLVARSLSHGVGRVYVVNDGNDGTASAAQQAGAKVIDHWPERKFNNRMIGEAFYALARLLGFRLFGRY